MALSSTEITSKTLSLSIALDKKYIDNQFFDKNKILDLDGIINQLITTLLYKIKRHAWNSDLCKDIRKLLEDLKPSFKGKNKPFYETYIVKQETLTNNFYGAYLSSDSDSEEEEKFYSYTELEKQTKYDEAEMYMERGQINKMTYNNNTGAFKKGDLKNIKNASQTFDLNERTKIYYTNYIKPKKIKQDLHLLNTELKQNIPLEQAIDVLKKKDPSFTDFYIAQYRGVTYLTTKWNQVGRKSHRKTDEINKSQYSTSILEASKINFFQPHTEKDKELNHKEKELNHNAELLKEIVLTLRETRPYSYNNYTYKNLAYLLQNIYSQDYDKFHTIIKTHPVLKCLFLNESNPFFSMGDIPYHAAKYAYGIKPYKGHESDRLRPRWKSNKKAERPYSGALYVSLHPITDFTEEGPLHLVSLNRSAEIKLDHELMIMPERESCFPAYVEENRVFHKHIAKYPSFKGDYKSIYYYKYGLTKQLYKEFQKN